jgi:hypothetical protein
MKENRSFKVKIFIAMCWFVLASIILSFILTSKAYAMISEPMYTSIRKALDSEGCILPVPDLSNYQYIVVQNGDGFPAPDKMITIYARNDYPYTWGNNGDDCLFTITNGSYLFRYYYTSSTNTWSYHVNSFGTSDYYSVGTLMFANHDIFRNVVGYVYGATSQLYANKSDQEEPGQNITYPQSYVDDGTSIVCPYYALSSDVNGTFFNISEEPFYVDNDGILRRSKTAYYYQSNDGGKTWANKVVYGNSTTVIRGSQVLSLDIKYNNKDIYRTNITNDQLGAKSYDTIKSAKTSEIVWEANPFNISTQTYTYEYDSTIEDLKGLTIEKDALYRTSWGLVIGESSTKYNVKWQAPEVSGLKLEISYQSKFNNLTRRYAMQTYKKPYFSNGDYVLPEQGTYKFDMHASGRVLLENLWNDIDTGAWISIPPTEAYFRYVSLNESTGKAKYGNWTRFDFSSGSQGVIETVKDKVNTVETYNPETGEIVYVDTETADNVTEHINSSGETIPEDQSFNGAVDTLSNALDSSTTAIQNIAGWVGQVPALIGNMFTFLPPEIIAFIGLSFVVLMILKIAGR